VAEDEYEKLLHDLEVLVECRKMLLSGSPTKARMALILLDALADALLHRRLRRVTAAGDMFWSWYRENPMFTESELRDARRSFDERIGLARQQFDDLANPGAEQELVSDVDAQVLSIGHSYRNLAHHQDKHNAAVITPLGIVVYNSVVSVFESAHSGGLVLESAEFWAELVAPLGIELELAEADVLTRGQVATLIAARLREGMDVPLDELVERLADDLDQRVEQVQAELASLPVEGAVLEAILRGLIGLRERAERVWTDDEIVRLARLYRSFIPRGNGADLELSPEAVEEINRIEDEMRKRAQELIEAADQPKTSPDALEKARAAAAAIRRTRDLVQALRTYQKADLALGQLAEHVEDIVTDYDRQTQLQSDLERGK
jgi:hypothetical protein